MRKIDAINRIKAGHPLICEHDEDGAAKYLVAGGGIGPKTALGIIARLQLVPQRDVLFDGLEPQTWRLP